MSTEQQGKINISLKEAVELIKSGQANVPEYVKVISEQNRAIREARHGIPSLVQKGSGR